MRVAAAGDQTAPGAEPGSGPPPGAELVDGVAAVVGREVILLSEVQERIRFFEAQMTPAQRDSLDPEQLAHDVLEGMIDDRLLVAEAVRDTIQVTTGEITEGVEQAMDRIQSNFPSTEAFEEQLAREGLSLPQLREAYRDIVRRQLLVQRVVQRKVYARVRVPDEEVRAFYDEHRREIPDVPARVVLDALLVTPKPSPEAEEAARGELQRIRQLVAGGADFAALAKQYSQAPGAERGGVLGTFRRGDLDPAFAAAESVAFALAPGEVSQPVRSQLGLHLIRVDAREGDRVRASHILLRLAPGAADSSAARARVEEALRRIRAGEDFGKVAHEMSDDPTTREQNGRLGTIAWDSLTEEYRETLEKLAPGEVAGPLAGPQGWQLLRLVAREDTRPPTFEEVAPEIRQHLAEQKSREKYQDWVAELRQKSYVRVVRAELAGAPAGRD